MSDLIMRDSKGCELIRVVIRSLKEAAIELVKNMDATAESPDSFAATRESAENFLRSCVLYAQGNCRSDFAQDSTSAKAIYFRELVDEEIAEVHGELASVYMELVDTMANAVFEENEDGYLEFNGHEFSRLSWEAEDTDFVYNFWNEVYIDRQMAAGFDHQQACERLSSLLQIYKPSLLSALNGDEAKETTELVHAHMKGFGGPIDYACWKTANSAHSDKHVTLSYFDFSQEFEMRYE